MRRQRFDYSFWLATLADKSDAILIPLEGYPIVDGQELYVFMRAGQGMRVSQVNYSINGVPAGSPTAEPWDLLPDAAAWTPEVVAQDIALSIVEAH